MRKKYFTDKERLAAADKQRRNWKKRPENRMKVKRSEFAVKLKNRYGLSVEEYAWTLHDQHRCPICLNVFDLNNSKSIHVDHDHSTKKVRGIICHDCNRNVIGKIDTKGIEVFMRAFKYLGLVL